MLNKKGVYNRYKLTRMVIDTEWEDKVRKESLEQGGYEVATEREKWQEWEGEEDIARSAKPKRQT